VRSRRLEKRKSCPSRNRNNEPPITASIWLAAEELNADSISFSVTYTGHDFAKLLAKIAYGFEIKEFGVSIIDDAYVLSVIRGDSKDIEKWVGCSGRQEYYFRAN